MKLELNTLMIQIRSATSARSSRVYLQLEFEGFFFVVVVAVVIWIKQYSSGLSINFVTGATQFINLCQRSL